MHYFPEGVNNSLRCAFHNLDEIKTAIHNQTVLEGTVTAEAAVTPSAPVAPRAAVALEAAIAPRATVVARTTTLARAAVAPRSLMRVDPQRLELALKRRADLVGEGLELGALLLGGPMYEYDRYSIYHALEVCAERLDLLELCHDAVLTLERYDRKHGTAFMGTLHAYLASGMNARETAQTLYIHRNTLAKRLEKINDLITVDLTDRETVFHLLFSLRVIEYYGAVRRREEFETWVTRVPTLRHR